MGGLPDFTTRQAEFPQGAKNSNHLSRVFWHDEHAVPIVLRRSNKRIADQLTRSGTIPGAGEMSEKPEPGR